MAELTPQERLQPSLLDRLTDEEPDQLQESREKRVLSMSRLRDFVLRDLAWLFNAEHPLSPDDAERYPFAARSAINFGIPPLAGLTLRIIDLNILENLLRQSVIDFEPRILGNSLRVRANLTSAQMNHNALTFEIEGELWGQPLPLQLYLKTEIDLESGQVKIEEETRQSRGR
ncbi:MAG: type VI secretion system baseplate subunit TssE [Candidatus Competibacteraceae bacterium]|jgi:type VI secretion system protein ImpF